MAAGDCKPRPTQPIGMSAALLTNGQKWAKMITQKELKATFIYNEQTGAFARRMAHNRIKPTGTINTLGYKVIGFKSKLWLAHRLAWLYVYGVYPDCDIDHIDENKSNNAISNLRLATRSQNMQNVRNPNKNNAQKVRGVYFHKPTGLYMAAIMIDGKSKHLGYFKDIEAAKLARETARKCYHSFAANI